MGVRLYAHNWVDTGAVTSDDLCGEGCDMEDFEVFGWGKRPIQDCELKVVDGAGSAEWGTPEHKRICEWLLLNTRLSKDQIRDISKKGFYWC